MSCFHLFTLTSRMISWYIKYGRQQILLKLTFSVNFTSVSRPKTLSQLTIISGKRLASNLRNSVKIVTGPH